MTFNCLLRFLVSFVLASASLAHAQPAERGNSATPVPRIVLDGFDASSYPFMNFVKMARNTFVNGLYSYQAILNADGYPKTTPAMPLINGIPIPPSYNGRYIIAWTGTARYQLAAGVTVYNGGASSSALSLTMPETSSPTLLSMGLIRLSRLISRFRSKMSATMVAGLVRIYATNNFGNGTTVNLAGVNGVSDANGTFTIANRTSGSFDLVGSRFSGSYVSGGRVIAVMSSVNLVTLNNGMFSNVSNLILCREADYTAILAGRIFNPDFVASLKALHPKVIRPLDINRAIMSNATDSNHRTSVNDFSYTMDKWLPDYWGGALSGTDAYSGEAAPGTPAKMTDGEIWQGQIVNSNLTTTPTLNIGGRGAYPILDMFATLQTVTIAGSPTPGDVLSFVFNAPYLLEARTLLPTQ